MAPKAKLSDLVMAVGSGGVGESIARFDREAGKMVYVEANVLAAVEQDPGYDGSYLAEWQRDSVRTAHALVVGDGTRFLDPPFCDASDAFEAMVAFADQWPNR